MSLTLVTASVAEPLSIEEVVAHSRIVATEDQAQILQWIKAATRAVEGYTQRRLITQTLDWRLDEFRTPLIVPVAPLISLGTLDYVDDAGATVVIGASGYLLDVYSEPARIYPAYGEVWPSTRAVPNAVRARITVGYGASGATIPKEIRIALLMLIDDLYEHRSAGTEIQVAPNPVIAHLLWPYRVPTGAW